MSGKLREKSALSRDNRPQNGQKEPISGARDPLKRRETENGGAEEDRLRLDLPTSTIPYLPDLFLSP